MYDIFTNKNIKTVNCSCHDESKYKIQSATQNYGHAA